VVISSVNTLAQDVKCHYWFRAAHAMSWSDELVDDYMNSSKQAAMYMRDFRCFHEEEKPKILELSRLNRIVAPHGRKITEKD
jgi:hypothetical protein